MRFDAIVIGGGYSGMEKARQLQESGLNCAVVSKGHSIYGYTPECFTKAGGTILMGDSVLTGKIENGRVVAVTTENLDEISLEADNFYLATGKFFAGGLVADKEKVYEPVFGLDVEYLHDRSEWFDKDFAKTQPFLDFGVVVDENGCAVKNGSSISNLFPIGEVVASKWRKQL